MCKGSTDYRSRNRSHRPHGADYAKPLPSESQRDKVRHNDLGKYNQGATANTLERTSDEQCTETVCYSGNDSSDHEENEGNHYHWFSAKDVGEGGGIRLKDRGTEQERGSGPEGFDCSAFEFVCDDLEFGLVRF